MSIYFSAYCFGWSISGSYVLVIVIVLKMISLKYKNEVLIGKMHFNTVIFCHASDLHIHATHKTLPDISKLSLINIQDHHRIQTHKAWDHSSTYEAEKILYTANYLMDGLQ